LLTVGAYLDGLYKATLVAHILCAIVGFGAVFLNGVYGAQAKQRPGAEGLAVAEANYRVSVIGELFIYAVFVLGILLVVESKLPGTNTRFADFSDTWVWVSMTIYLGALAVSHAVLLPSVRRIIALMRELVAMGPPPVGATAGPPPAAVELEKVDRRVAITGTSLDLALVAILVLMVWKPH
jgi:hypothetical protein